MIYVTNDLRWVCSTRFFPWFFWKPTKTISGNDWGTPMINQWWGAMGVIPVECGKFLADFPWFVLWKSGYFSKTQVILNLVYVKSV